MRLKTFYNSKTKDSKNTVDKERAQFILRSFRPDGSDVEDCDFAEALAMAMENRELGEWLADERAFDASFAKALSSVELPEGLRQDILGCLAGERGDYPQAGDAQDADFIGALASVQTPPSLRMEILAAMERSTRVSPTRQKKWFFHRLAMPVAAAAGVAFAFFLFDQRKPAILATSGPLPLDVVQAGFLRTFESPLFSLDETRKQHEDIVAHLKSRNLPCPCCLPPGLANVKGIGCRELDIDGKSGTLICFDEGDNGVLHLLIFRRQDVCGDFPPREHPVFAQNGRWAAARWEDHNKVYILTGNTEIKKLSTIF